MIEKSDIRAHYSSEVRLFLQVNGRSWRLAKVGPGRIYARDPIDLDPCDAEIVMFVDENEHRWDVYLTDGAVPFDPEIRTVKKSTEDRNLTQPPAVSDH